MERAGERERGEFLGEARGECRGEGLKRLEGRWKAGCTASSSSSRLWASSSWSLKVLRLSEWQEEPELRLDAVAAYSCLKPAVIKDKSSTPTFKCLHIPPRQVFSLQADYTQHGRGYILSSCMRARIWTSVTSLSLYVFEEPTESSSISEVLSSLSTDDCGLRGGGFLSAAVFRW